MYVLVHCHLLCFLAGDDALLVVFENGASYSACPNNPTRTLLSLKCAPDQNWEYSGDTGNATSHLVSINPSVIGGCEVCLFVVT